MEDPVRFKSSLSIQTSRNSLLQTHQNPSATCFHLQRWTLSTQKLRTVATSCCQSLSSGHSLSGGTHHAPPVDEESGSGGLDEDIHTFGASNDQDREQEPTVNEVQKCQTLPRKPRVKSEGHLWRVKVTFAEDKIRFRMQKDWGFNDLLQEIGKRLTLKNISGYNIKYLDDDSEWILLTCDVDVEECIDVYRSFKGGTIRLTRKVPFVMLMFPVEGGLQRIVM